MFFRELYSLSIKKESKHKKYFHYTDSNSLKSIIITKFFELRELDLGNVNVIPWSFIWVINGYLH